MRILQQFKASRLISSFSNGTIRENKDTVDMLRCIGQPAVRPLLNALKSDDRTTQLEAVRALGFLKDEEALPALSELLKSQDPELAKQAEKAIGRILAAHNKNKEAASPTAH